MRFLSRVVLTLMLVAIGSSGVAQTQTPPAVQSVDIGLTSRTATDWPVYIAESLGYFKKYGIAPTFIVVGSAAGNAQQLAAGSIGIGETSSTQIVEAIHNGAPLKYVLNRVITPPYGLMAKKPIRSLADLRGKTIIVGGINDITRVFTDTMLKSAGLKPDDFTYTYAGATAERFAALKSGSVDAAILFPPFDFLAEDQGFTRVASVQRYFPAFPFDGFAVNRTWAQSHSTIIVAFIKCYLDGLRWLKTPANKDAAIRILAQATNTTPANGLRTYDALVKSGAYSNDARTDPRDFQKVINALADLKVLTAPLPVPSQFFDNQYADLANGRRH